MTPRPTPVFNPRDSVTLSHEGERLLQPRFPLVGKVVTTDESTGLIAVRNTQNRIDHYHPDFLVLRPRKPNTFTRHKGLPRKPVEPGHKSSIRSAVRRPNPVS